MMASTSPLDDELATWAQESNFGAVDEQVREGSRRAKPIFE